MTNNQRNLQDPPEHEIPSVGSMRVVRDSEITDASIFANATKGLSRLLPGDQILGEEMNLTGERLQAALVEADRRGEKARNGSE